MNHQNHPLPDPSDMPSSFPCLPEEAKADLLSLIEVSADFNVIRDTMYKKYQIIVCNDTIGTARKKFMSETLTNLGIDPGHSSCDKLIAYFKSRNDVSYIAVTHAMDSGFVTMRKNIRESIVKDISDSTNNENRTAINKAELNNWRKTLKVGDGKRILVAFAWMHNVHHRKILMYPEMLSADVTFGVCKEDRNLLRVVGVDGDLKVFECMNCFMPSKQFRAYDWALSVAFPKLVGKDILPFNNLFTSDQEMALAVSIRKLLGDGGGK